MGGIGFPELMVICVIALLVFGPERLPSLAPPASVAGAQARFRLFDALTGFLRRRAQQGPLVLVLDDLHWADKAQ